MILYIENLLHPKPIKLSEFSKFAGNKINTQNSVEFLYTNNEISAS